MNPGPPAPKAGIIPLDHWATYIFWNIYDKGNFCSNAEKVLTRTIEKSSFTKKREHEKQYLSIPENRQKHNEYHLKRYHEKKDEINARRNAKPKPNITCECGAVIQNIELTRHKKSIKHLEAIKNI